MSGLTIRRQRLLFAALYFTEGAPVGYIWWALPTQLRSAGVPVPEITMLSSLLVLPWGLKFLWAPLIDVLTTNRWTLRHWIISAQCLMATSLSSLFFFDYASSFSLMAAFLLLHAVAAATQDVGIDALAIRTVPSNERGRVNGWMQAGMLVGRSLFGGASLVILSLLDNAFVLAALIVAIIASATALALVPLPSGSAIAREEGDARFGHFFQRLKSVLGNRTTWLGFAVALVGGAAFEGTGAVAGPFLIDRGFSHHTVGTFFSLPGVLAMIAGSLVGGFVADRLNKPAAVSVFAMYIAAVVMAIGFWDVYAEGKNDAFILMLTLLYFGIGLFTAASYAFFMEITEPRLAATQFSAYMGVTNLCESWSALLIGRLIGGFGYPVAFISMSLISLSVLPALRVFKQEKHAL
ncbi:MAG TPA: MFS transporter [Bacteroidota bacterium]|nr:MFS transporter [Bacteroidota bacterium]